MGQCAAGVMGEKFIPEMYGIILESLRKRMSRQFKADVLNRFIRYMNFNCGVSAGKGSDEK